ncbi:hypothetical protein, partial [Aequorivita antarctica]|uniref:hypothetical protein n=1 Tax=Aequorivita antarctica TaxID=153266 RepID=UPI001B865CDF
AVKIVLWNALAQTEIVEELFLVDLFSLHTMKLRKIANLCNRHNGYSSLRRNFLPKILAVLLSFGYSGKVLRTFSATNHSLNVVP